MTFIPCTMSNIQILKGLVKFKINKKYERKKNKSHKKR